MPADGVQRRYYDLIADRHEPGRNCADDPVRDNGEHEDHGKGHDAYNRNHGNDDHHKAASPL